MLLLQVLVIGALVAATSALILYDAHADARREAGERAVAVARTIAQGPTVQESLLAADPSARLQPYTELTRSDVGVDFVVIMSLDRIRYTHPDPGQLGKPFRGDVGGAPRGDTFVQEYAGTLGPSVRAVVPVHSNGRVSALVSVGITVERISSQVWPRLLITVAVGSAVLATGLLGSVAVSRRLRRQTHGLSEAELARMYEYHHAVLHAVREGLLLLDGDHQVRLINDEACRLLGLSPEVQGRRVDALGLPPALVDAALGSREEIDDLYLVGSHVLVVSSRPACWEGDQVGTVVTLRDRTELQAVSGELDVVRRLSASLRAKNHESANRLHTVVSLIEMGRPDEAVDFATEELQIVQVAADQVMVSIADPVLAALLLDKMCEADERGVTMQVSGAVAEVRCPIPARDVVTVTGNLIDNAVDAVCGSTAARVSVQVSWDETGLELSVGDDGPGIPAGQVDQVMQRGWSTKAASSEGRGLGLALVAQIAARHGGRLTVGTSPLGGAEVSVSLRAVRVVGS